MKLFCGTSSGGELDNMKNAAMLRDLIPESVWAKGSSNGGGLW